MISIPAKHASVARKILLPVFTALMFFGHHATAQILTRAIPDDTRRATISFVQDMYVSVNGTPVQLAPGALIRDQSNLIIVPSALPQGGALAEYGLDGNGQIFRVWLLTPEEAARNRPFPR